MIQIYNMLARAKSLITHHWFRQWLGTEQAKKAIVWTDDGQVDASLGLNQLRVSGNLLNSRWAMRSHWISNAEDYSQSEAQTVYTWTRNFPTELHTVQLAVSDIS